MENPIIYDTPTPNPDMTPAQHKMLRDNVLVARDLLNRALNEAAQNGIAVETRLVGCMNIGAARAGVPQHFLVEALPVRSTQEVEAEERQLLASLKFKYESPYGALLRS